MAAVTAALKYADEYFVGINVQLSAVTVVSRRANLISSFLHVIESIQ